MKLGFIGAGTISNAVIRAFCAKDSVRGNLGIEAIFISPRNAKIARKLAADFACIKIAENNQQIADNADIIFIAVPGALIESVLAELHFKPQKKLISFVPTADIKTIRNWTKQTASVFRAMPLPFIAEHKIPTPIFPADKDLERIFGAAGGCIIAKEEKDFSLYMVAGSMMGAYYRFCGLCCSWLADNGLGEAEAKIYGSSLFSALAEQARGGNSSYAKLQEEYSTKGGTNELITDAYNAHGGGKALIDALNDGLAQIDKK